ncbi:MAG TPA: Ig-like domain-containing protein [Roseomonas sp.]|nr:Ig-like domain-containing protein [Roseomonas sp.]
MPSPNDLIANAALLDLGVPVAGAIAADDTAAEPGEANYNYFNANGSVWYKYTAAAAGPVTISVTGSEGWDADAAPDAGLIVFSGPATGATVEGLGGVANNLVTNDLQHTVSFNAAAGQTYYIQVTGGGETTGDFSIAVNALAGAVITGYTDDTGTPGDNSTSDHDLTITGLATPNSLVTLYNVGTDGSLAPIEGATVTAGADGSWSINTGPLPDGDYRFSATATPPGGAASDPSSILELEVVPELDTIPPEAPAALALDPASDTGAPGDGITADTTPTITGTAEAGAIVTLYDTDGTTVLGTGTASATDGTWAITPTVELGVGPHTLTAKAADAAGNVSVVSAGLGLTIGEEPPPVDTTPPDAPAALLLDPASDTHVLGNNITADTTPTITGTAEAGALVTLYDTDGTTALGTATASATDGTWAITPTTALAAGLHTLTAKAADAAGNVSPVSEGLALQINVARDPGDFPGSEPGFDKAYYLAHNPDVAGAGIDALTHYQSFGWQEGRDPNAFFNTDFYLNQNPDVAAAHVDPLLHYLQHGAAEGRDPSIAFDSSAYLEANQDVATAGLNPLVHYLMFGQVEERAVSAATPHATGPQDPLVDATFYYNTYGDVAALGLDPTSHYEQYGWHEGRDPNAYFDTSYYLTTYDDVARAGIDPLQHYEEFGWKEGRDPSTAFDTSYYLEANVDVADAGMNPLQHWLEYGINEAGRSPVAPA